MGSMGGAAMRIAHVAHFKRINSKLLNQLHASDRHNNASDSSSVSSNKHDESGDEVMQFIEEDEDVMVAVALESANPEFHDNAENIYGVLSLVFLEARNLKSMDSGGTSDPFVKLKLVDQTAGNSPSKSKTLFKSKVVRKSLNPVWYTA